MAVFEALSGEKPVLLLDDVMSELDLNRRARLLEEIKGYQTFITCTDLSDLEGCEYERCYQVTLNSDGTADVRMTQSGLEFEGDQPKENDLDPDFS